MPLWGLAWCVDLDAPMWQKRSRIESLKNIILNVIQGSLGHTPKHPGNTLSCDTFLYWVVFSFWKGTKFDVFNDILNLDWLTTGWVYQQTGKTTTKYAPIDHGCVWSILSAFSRHPWLLRTRKSVNREQFQMWEERSRLIKQGGDQYNEAELCATV